MKIYRVGGAVRDQLLHYPSTETDWLVVGAVPEQLLSQGYRQVGKDFPVFLHPKTGEEYALARTERKSSAGYTGFTVYADSSVTLEEDLLRRDLTINAMAEDAEGNVIDPYGGRADLQAKCLRHVSPAFVEDPLRVLRVARFAARYWHLGFRIAPATQALMHELAAGDELLHLSAERVWRETERALGEKDPHVYFQVLHDCGALGRWFPELEALFGVPQRAEYHPEIDTGQHSLLSLQIAAQLSDDAVVRFAALVHDVGKALTPSACLPRHPGHELAGEKPLAALAKRVKLPNKFRDLAQLVTRLHLVAHCAGSAEVDALLDLMLALTPWRQPERWQQFLLACEADYRGRAGWQTREYPQAAWLHGLAAAVGGVDISVLKAQKLQGRAFGVALRKLQRECVADFVLRMHST